MPDIICNTSPIQYLHQLGLLHLLPSLADRITIPTAVAEELDEGRRLGVSLPDVGTLAWVTIRSPHSMPVLRLVTDLGPGETEVLALALETEDPIVMLDDAIGQTRGGVPRAPIDGDPGCASRCKAQGSDSTGGPGFE